MYFWGELIIHHKVHTRKVYDFTNRHLPQELLQDPDPNRTQSQYYSWYVLRRIASIGMVWNKSGDAWLGITGIKSRERNAAFNRLLKEKKIAEVMVEGLEQPLYIKGEDQTLMEEVRQGKEVTRRAVILAPLDNLLWDRRLIKELFGFDYRWEVYKPEVERQYGYYVLPVLYGDRFIARFEPVRDRKQNILIIKNWWWEPDVLQTSQLHRELDHCFREFARFLGVESIQWSDKALSNSWITG
jgi:uncharacterized protein YcaQ